MENLRKRVDVTLINNKKDHIRCVNIPNLISQKIFSKNFVVVYQIKPVLTLSKPIYVGFTTLELSKLLMYKFHYQYPKNIFDAKLLFTNTESLVYKSKKKMIMKNALKAESC